eukprot:CAMPEP_0175454942 /NCGR_PEP_ID=MMETSP0095-20121207/64759_1 /TAXON_ID=311494 /ORGANISM="Alexandrium monilatum, Strain CCMP3105" /LENGTH=103 /DNA_ID=CAMNT_0016755689 /DNA_START=137 /DNA_END=444 /DNA_ORIENTATION=-
MNSSLRYSRKPVLGLNHASMLGLRLEQGVEGGDLRLHPMHAVQFLHPALCLVRLTMLGGVADDSVEAVRIDVLAALEKLVEGGACPVPAVPWAPGGARRRAAL